MNVTKVIIENIFEVVLEVVIENVSDVVIEVVFEERGKAKEKVKREGVTIKY